MHMSLIITIMESDHRILNQFNTSRNVDSLKIRTAPECFSADNLQAFREADATDLCHFHECPNPDLQNPLRNDHIDILALVGR